MVEDDRTARLLLRGLLERVFGYEVAEAVDGVDGLEQIHRQQPDIVLLDLRMLKLDGIDVLRGMRATKRFADLPVIAVSSLSEQQTIVEMVGLGIADYILKPIGVRSARVRLEKALRGIEQRTQRVATSKSQTSPSRALLVVEKDPKFRSFVSTLLDTEFDVQTVDDPFAALEIVGENLAKVVLVGDDLDLLQAPAFARVARCAANGADLRLILISAGTELSKTDAEHFDAIVRKSFVPETFTADFRRALETVALLK